MLCHSHLAELWFVFQKENGLLVQSVCSQNILKVDCETQLSSRHLSQS